MLFDMEHADILPGMGHRLLVMLVHCTLSIHLQLMQTISRHCC